ncbi:HNH endonuclease [Photobacterium salinisoli]|uniref:HNH endonuclease n=1 Tax=Photobacterium salinisoli TaxID=1616783 RepID=UPI00196900BA|nr:HNH endonuclease [Photobacterium salinisoli]
MDAAQKESIGLLGDAENGVENFFAHQDNKQKFFTATKNFVTGPENAALVAVLNDSHATPAQKQAAYGALSGYISDELGITPAEALLAVVETYGDQATRGAYANGTLYINDSEHYRLEDAVNTVGHETQHHIDAQRGHQGDGETYEQNREQYAEVMGEATEDYLSFNYSNAGHGEFGGWNTQNGTQGSELISQNQSRFDHDRQSGQMDFRLPNEKEQHALNKLAGDDPAKQRELLSAACAMIKCSAEFAFGSDEYEYYRALEDEGANHQDAQAVLANYSDKVLTQGDTYPAVKWETYEDLYQYTEQDRISDAEQLVYNHQTFDRMAWLERQGLTPEQAGVILALGGVAAAVIDGKSGKIKQPKLPKHTSTSSSIQGQVDAGTRDEYAGPYNPNSTRADLEAMYGADNVTSTTNPKNPIQTVNSNLNRGIEVIRGTDGGKAVRVQYNDPVTGQLSVANIPYNGRDLPIFDDHAKYTTSIDHSVSYNTQMKRATENLRDAINSGRIDSSLFTDIQLQDIQNLERKVTGFTWHHNGDSGNMQLVPTKVHDAVKHIGQSALSKGR